MINFQKMTKDAVKDTIAASEKLQEEVKGLLKNYTPEACFDALVHLLLLHGFENADNTMQIIQWPNVASMAVRDCGRILVEDALFKTLSEGKY